MIRTSVILCVRNGAATIAEQLAALAAQDHADSWELVVVDNGSSDGTVALVREWEDRLPGLTVVQARERAGLAYARNVGVRVAQGQVLAFCDADDAAHPGWLGALVARAEEAEMVGGRLELDRLNSPLAMRWRARPEPVALPTALGYLTYAAGANLAVRKDAFEAAGGCDERFTFCGDDLDLSWRIQREGGSLLFSPEAVMHYRLRADLRGVMRQRYRYGEAEALLRLKFSDAIPPVAPRARARSVARMLAHSGELAGGAGRRGAWLAQASHLAGQLSGSARYRVLA
ncbi:MAG TPA: glycosyltransferase [Solirubrobacteraceae bacterium]